MLSAPSLMHLHPLLAQLSTLLPFLAHPPCCPDILSLCFSAPLPLLSAPAVCAALGVPAVLVVVESAHMCMVARGVEKHASTTLTTAARGAWVDDVLGRAAALEALLECGPPQSPRHRQLA